ncbi:hypothetical protein [Enhygromyxa salina]|uniref:Uncharacterized protein n=1 Tax=Enhygromyxa salina TaxID=215803 RepID=A0A2S9YRB1_9BACT|nr:hypothetical protein [Enhygromyxa salina]PRQ07635.1 hypothetical protein ENSA7_26250 [Enhygromyxa salina]
MTVTAGDAHTPAGDLLEQVAALKHDLGKYVAWTSANLDDAVWDGPVAEELITALRADLLETRKHGDRREAAWEIWQAHEAALPRPLEPELQAVGSAVAQLERVGEALLSGDRETVARERASIRAAQQDIRLQLRNLHRRLLRDRD